MSRPQKRVCLVLYRIRKAYYVLLMSCQHSISLKTLIALHYLQIKFKPFLRCTKHKASCHYSTYSLTSATILIHIQQILFSSFIFLLGMISHILSDDLIPTHQNRLQVISIKIDHDKFKKYPSLISMFHALHHFLVLSLVSSASYFLFYGLSYYFFNFIIFVHIILLTKNDFFHNTIYQ